MKKKACKKCRRIVEKDVCPTCKTSDFTEDWSGYVVIIDPSNSEIAKKLNITEPGRYALRVR
jgi:DNA-directed RNA polymerase subunit E"